MLCLTQWKFPSSSKYNNSKSPKILKICKSAMLYLISRFLRSVVSRCKLIISSPKTPLNVGITTIAPVSQSVSDCVLLGTRVTHYLARYQSTCHGDGCRKQSAFTVPPHTSPSSSPGMGSTQIELNLLPDRNIGDGDRPNEFPVLSSNPQPPEPLLSSFSSS